MSRTVKLVLYIVCVAAVSIFAVLVSRSYRDAVKSAKYHEERISRLMETTNLVDSTNIAASTNEASLTNALAGTNAAGPMTNSADAQPDGLEADTAHVAGVSARGYTRMVTFGLCLLASVIGLAVLVAHDVSHFFAHRAEKLLFNDDGQPADPEYERAEELWKDGHYLEAIQAMRDYLKKHPREQYVALRIAEIYEENLRNYLAAALEYEEVLTKNLPPERWGWAAIHLANIYSGKLSQPDKAIALLHRIDAEYGQTAAAKKARERLAQIDPEFAPATEQTADSASDSPANLPPGFRPK